MYSVRYRTVHSQKKYGTDTFMINGTSIFAIIITYLADSTVQCTLVLPHNNLPVGLHKSIIPILLYIVNYYIKFYYVLQTHLERV